MLVRNTSINYFTAVEKYSFEQDTAIHQQEIKDDSLQIITKDTTKKDFINFGTIKTFDLQAIDSILKISEERERQIKVQTDSIAKRPVYRRKLDTTELYYQQFGIAGFPLHEELDKDPFQQNIFLNFSDIKPEEAKPDQVFAHVSAESNTVQLVQEKEKIQPKYFTKDAQFDWITILIVAVFLLLGWVSLFNKKYLGSLVKAVVSYNEANTLYREKNSLMVRASFIINIIFISAISLFIIQLNQYLNLGTEKIAKHLLYLFVALGFIGLYLLRFISAKFIGFVFLQQRIFSEYLHNVNIYTKVTGLLLLPVVIALQYLAVEYLIVILWIGLIIIGFLYFLQTLRAFQILIRNNVSIFYMILYLCAVEIAPFLMIYKLLLS
jgi:hypothetical protein